MKAPSNDMMNTLAKSVLTLSSYDAGANDISLSNVLRQCLWLIAVFPLISVYGYQAYNFYLEKQSLFIHQSDPSLSTAENLLHLLRPDSRYTALEASVLGSFTRAARRTRRRQQFDLYHPCRDIVGDRYVFCDCSGALLPEGTEARRRQH